MSESLSESFSDSLSGTEAEALVSALTESPIAPLCPIDPVQGPSWKVLVVDDDEDVHAITRLALRTFTIENKPLWFLHAHSAAEAEEILQKHPDIAVVLLDVVMENQRSGLEVVDFIRKRLGNDVVRIIIRTGQPGLAPEMSIVEDYQIDDYRLKTDLTQSKLHSILMASLRTYEAMLRGEAYARSLEQKVNERTAVIRRQKEELEALNQVKDRLFSILSHDLRSPLVTLTTLVEVARRNLIEGGNVIQILGEVSDRLDHVLPMLDQLLSWAHSQLQGFHLSPHAFELESWLTESIGLQQAAAGLKQQQLWLESAPPGEVCADREMMTLVLRNLIQNAIKFTPAGGEICVMARQSETLPGEIEIEVRDSGIGLTDTDLAKLQRGEPSSRRGTNGEHGTGLGLLLCREFTQRNGGRFWIRSILGEGSAFGFSLPRA